MQILGAILAEMKEGCGEMKMEMVSCCDKDGLDHIVG
jgi:hypothetical protein